MILNLLRVEELRVEDMMKRSFAELGKLAAHSPPPPSHSWVQIPTFLLRPESDPASAFFWVRFRIRT